MKEKKNPETEKALLYPACSRKNNERTATDFYWPEEKSPIAERADLTSLRHTRTRIENLTLQDTLVAETTSRPSKACYSPTNELERNQAVTP